MVKIFTLNQNHSLLSTTENIENNINNRVFQREEVKEIKEQNLWQDIFSNEIVIGAMGSIVGAVILAILGYSFKKYLLTPFDFLYSMIAPRSVSGKWKTKYWTDAEEEPCNEDANISQFLYKVWGEIYHPGKKRNYKFSGTIRNDILVAVYEVSKNNSTRDRGSFTLILNRIGEANKLDGYCSWTDDDSNGIKGSQYIWIKKDE
jgi:hypothetical protein